MSRKKGIKKVAKKRVMRIREPLTVPAGCRLLTVDEVAERLGLGCSMARRLILTELPMIRVGTRLIRVPEVGLEQWIRDHTVRG